MEAQKQLTLIVDQLSLFQKCLKSRPGLYEHSLLTANIASSIVLGSGIVFGYSPMQAYIAGIVHDVGMMFVPELFQDHPRNQPTSSHLELGAWFVRGTLFESYSDTILQHHDCRFDGMPPNRVAELPKHIRLMTLSDCVADIIGTQDTAIRPAEFANLCKKIKAACGLVFSDVNPAGIEEAIMNFVTYQRNASAKQSDFGLFLGATDHKDPCQPAKCQRPGNPEGCEVGLCQRHLKLVKTL